MADPAGAAALDRECLVFARYLTGRQASAYAMAKYREAHQRDARIGAGTMTRFDRLLLSLARASSPGAWLVDAYTAVFFKPAVVRKKWVLLVAILESTAPTAEFFDVPETGGRLALLARLAWRGVMFGAGLVASLVLLLPLHLVFAGTSRGRDSHAWRA